MKVAIIGTVGVPAQYGGYETLVENLLSHKENKEIEYHVYCSGKTYKQKTKYYKGAKLYYLPFQANGWQSFFYDSFSLIHAYFTADIILSLGTVGCFILPICKLFSKKKVIVNLDGLDHTRAKWNNSIKLVLSIIRKLAANWASVRIADNEIIQQYIKKVYKKDSVLIEYGGDQAKPVYDYNKLSAKYGLTPKTYSFKVARIEPENNIEMILEAYSMMPNELLIIVGNWEKNQFGQNLRKKYQAYTNIKMLNPIYEQNELNLLRSNCKIYIHGHSVGGTNPSLVEAMCLQLPIIAYDVNYNRSTTENQALYFHDTKSLINNVETLNNGIDIERLGCKMLEIAHRRYLWNIICKKYEKLYC